MATTKWAADSVMDAALDKIATSVMLRVCSGTSSPADRAAAISATLADEVLTSGDFTKANGDASGRKVTIAQQPSIAIDATGDATCITLDDGTNLLYVTTCTTQTLTSGGTVTVPQWKVEIADPTP